MPKINSHGFKPRQNVTVVPLNFHEQASVATSPRNHSKSKLKLVSPSLRNSSLLKQNDPPKMTGKDFSKQRSSAQIQLGGKVDNTLRTHPNRQTAEISQTSIINSVVYSHSRNNSRDILIPSPYSGPGTHSRSPIRPTSPARISIHYRSSQTNPAYPTYPIPIFSGATQPSSYKASKVENQGCERGQVETPPMENSSLFSSSHKSLRKGEGVSVNNFPSDFAIQEENSMQNLKESYEGEINEIRKLQEEIATNNIEIKSLLKNSKSTKKSQTKAGQKEEEEKSEHLAHSREPSIWNAEQPKGDCPDNNFFSKKTLINDLKIQTENKLEAQTNGRRSNGEVSVQTDNCLPVESVSSHPSLKSETKVRKLSMVKNHECQVQVTSTSQKRIQNVFNDKRSQKSLSNSLKGSIVDDAHSHFQDDKTSEKKSEGSSSLAMMKSRKRPGQISQQKIEVAEEEPVKRASQVEEEGQIKHQQTEKKDQNLDVKSQLSEHNQCSPIPVSQQILPECLGSEKISPAKEGPIVVCAKVGQVSVLARPGDKVRKIYNKIYL